MCDTMRVCDNSGFTFYQNQIERQAQTAKISFSIKLTSIKSIK